ncbi:MAG: alpha-amylase, partial [Thiotrichaceae bacterium]|nr:alpha-amylase [Thiotrichaceae bacterium]
MKNKLKVLREKIKSHVTSIYPDADSKKLTQQLLAAMDLNNTCKKPKAHKNNWNQQDVIAITYGDSIVRKGEQPLQTLHQFFKQNFSDIINSIHILPFYPYSSDDGFSVINYKQVNQKLGDWQDIENISSDFK